MPRKKVWKRKRTEERLARYYGTRATEEVSTRESKMRKTAQSDEEQEEEYEIEGSNYDKLYRNLPTEIINNILSYCTQHDLTVIARVSKYFRQKGTAYLYARFEPRTWPHIVMMNQTIQRGVKSNSAADRVIAKDTVRAIQEINIPLLESGQDADITNLVSDEVEENLLGIIRKARNLSSFSRDFSGISAKNDDIWMALRTCRLRTLRLRDCNPVPLPLSYNATSKLWCLTNLTVIELKMPWCNEDSSQDSSIQGACKMIECCPKLKALTLHFVDHHQSMHNGAMVKCDDLFRSPVVAQVATLDLEGIFASNSQVISSFLKGLQQVESLRLLHGNQYRHGLNTFEEDAEADALSIIVARDDTVALPNLRCLETDLRNIKAIISKSNPTILRNVRIDLQSDDASSVEDMASLKHNTSIQEMHLLLYAVDTSDEAVRRRVVSTLGHIPTSIQRLALLFPVGEDYFSWHHENQALCFLEPLHRLTNLKIIVLPWRIIKSGPENRVASPALEGSGPYYWAALVGQKLAKTCPELEYIYLQGSSKSDCTGDPYWKVKWGEIDDLGRRWTLKIHRGEDVTKPRQAQKNQEAEKGESASAVNLESCTAESVVMVGSGTSLNDEVVLEIKIEVISTSCPCYRCFIDQDEDSKACVSGSSSESM